MTRLELKNISKMYPNGTNAVKNISITAEQGEFLVLVGPSGCGKSTILRMIAGLEEVSAGEILFDGKAMQNLPPKDRDVGMVFQNYALYPHLTVSENIAFPLVIKKIKKAAIKSKVEETAEMLEITKLLDKKPKEISGGERQRVALGRAIIREPRLFLFDEPLSNLDAKLRVQMRTEIINLQRKLGITSVYVTHDQTEAMTMGSKIIVLKSGEIMQFDSPENIYNQPANVFTASFIGSPPMNLFDGSFARHDKLMFIEKSENGCKFEIENNDKFNFIAKEIKDVTFGIRPENIYISDTLPNKDSFIFEKIINIEYLGHENLVFFKTSGKIRSVRTTSLLNFKIGQKVYFCFNSSNLIAYDSNGNIIT